MDRINTTRISDKSAGERKTCRQSFQLDWHLPPEASVQEHSQTAQTNIMTEKMKGTHFTEIRVDDLFKILPIHKIRLQSLSNDIVLRGTPITTSAIWNNGQDDRIYQLCHVRIIQRRRCQCLNTFSMHHTFSNSHLECHDV